MIRLQHISKSYTMSGTTVDALKSVSLDITPGELISVQGTSGSGKSTLLNIIGLLDTASRGKYQLRGHSVENINQAMAAKYRNEYIGFIFQAFNLIHYKTTIENIALPLFYKGISRRKRNTIALEYLDIVGLRDRATHKPSELSGGQSQRVAIARALVTQPALILADEPTGALDSYNTTQIMSLFKEVNSLGTAILIVTHETDIAEQTHRKIHMKDGEIISDHSNMVSNY